MDSLAALSQVRVSTAEYCRSFSLGLASCHSVPDQAALWFFIRGLQRPIAAEVRRRGGFPSLLEAFLSFPWETFH